MNRLEILNEVFGSTEWSESALSTMMKVIELAQREARKQQLKSIVDNLMTMHDAAANRHSYYHFAANYLKQEYEE